MVLQKMKTESVLIEKEDKTHNTVVGSSGLMLNDKYVITTANILFDQIPQTVIENIEPGKLYRDLPICDNFLNVVLKGSEFYTVKKAKVIAMFTSDNIRNSNKFIFQNWAVDSIDNNRNLNRVMSVFFVLSFKEDVSLEDFKGTLREWWNLVIQMDLKKGDTLYVRSTPFGNRNFMNSLSKGIVSNVLGKFSCFVLSDCPCAPGCEGAPAYLCHDKFSKEAVPFGLVICSLSWWRGEWIGLTLVADIRPIILELIDLPVKIMNGIVKMTNPNVIATAEYSVAQIYCGKSWGTAILLSQEKGIFITNSHVVENGNLIIFYKGKSCEGRVVYKTPPGEVFDLAIVKSNPGIVKDLLTLRSISISRKKIRLGDTVYSVGYPIFPKDSNPTPSISKGCISQMNPFMIRTTCSIHPGSSGGAILDCEGALLGIIVCNSKLQENGVVYPRINMAVPLSAISETIKQFLEKEDSSVLCKLHVKNEEGEYIWKRIEGKL